MAHSSKQYQRVYTRNYASSDTLKETKTTLLNEILKLEFETSKFLEDQLNNKKTKPTPINASYKLPEQQVNRVKTEGSIPLNIVGEYTENKLEGVIETLLVKIPVTETLNDLIPFHKNIALKFYAKYGKNLVFPLVKEALLQLQELTVKQLQTVKTQLTTMKTNLVNLRLNQERRKAIKHLEKALHISLTSRFNKLSEYMKDPEKQQRFWIMCMKKLRREGYGYTEALLATNYLTGLTDEPPLNPQSFDSVIHQELSSNCYSDDPIIETWQKENPSERILIEHYYTLYRKKELLEEQHQKQWLIDTPKLMQRYANEGYSRNVALYNCMRNGFSEQQIKQALEWYDIEKRKPVKLNVITHENTVEIVTEDLQNKWIKCMAHESGLRKGGDPDQEANPFDQAVERCTYSTFRNTGETVKPNTFERGKKFWTPGYWHTHNDILVDSDEQPN